MITLRKRVSLAALLAVTVPATLAQTTQVPIPEEPSTQPQIQFDGTAIVTLQTARTDRETGGHVNDTGVDFSDSSITFGAAQRLFRGGAVGSMAFGFLTPESGEEGDVSGKTELFVHQAFVDYQSRRLETYLGRTNQPASQLVEFPTLREEDLITFTHLMNPYSSGENAEEHRYGNVAALTLNRRLTDFVNVHAEHLLNSGEDAGGSGINSVGLSYQHLGPPGLEAIQRVVQWGAGYERRKVPDRWGGPQNAVYAGAVVNLRPSMVRRVDLRLFGSATFGNDTETLVSPTDAFRADARSVAAAVRFLHSPFGMPSSQVSLTAGYRTYPKADDASAFGVALTGVKRLGQGFDAVAQYTYEHRDDDLAAALGGKRDHRLEVGLIMNFGATFNKHLGPRRTLLNLRHRYIPQ